MTIAVVFSTISIATDQSWHHGRELVVAGFLVVLTVPIPLLTILRLMAQRRFTFRPGVAIRIVIDGERTRPDVIGWNRVTSAREFFSVFAVRLQGESVLFVPKRAFDDAGATQYLIPGPPRSNSSITNTRQHTSIFYSWPRFHDSVLVVEPEAARHVYLSIRSTRGFTERPRTTSSSDVAKVGARSFEASLA